jgi:cytochrome c oxidase cbb3-type subunit 4
MTMDLQTMHEVLGSFWTVWAVLIFAGIVRWVLRPANRERFEQDARIPLKDEG